MKIMIYNPAIQFDIQDRTLLKVSFNLDIINYLRGQ